MELNGYSITNKRLGLSAYTIYIINVLNNIYVGSTSDFRKRRREHISHCHNPKCKQYNIPLYKHVRELEEKGEFKFDKNCFDVEFIIFNADKVTALQYEKETLEKFKNKGFEILNKFSPLQTEEDLKARIKAYNQDYNQSEKVKAYRKAYRLAYYKNPKNKERKNLLQRLNRAKKKAEKQNIIINK